MKRVLSFIFVFIACRGPQFLSPPSVKDTIQWKGGAIEFTWDILTGIEGYRIYIDDSLKDSLKPEINSYFLKEPAKKIEFVSYKGDNESEPYTHTYYVTTSTFKIWKLSDGNDSQPSGFALFPDSSSPIKMINAQDVNEREKCDFILDDMIKEPDSLYIVGPRAWSPPFSNEYNRISDTTGKDYDQSEQADTLTNYADFRKITDKVLNKIFYLWFTPDSLWDDSTDYFAKFYITGPDTVNNSYTIKIAFQKRSGLRWLVTK